MPKILSPCSSRGEWHDGGSTSFTGTITIHDKWLTGAAMDLQTYTTPTLARGRWVWFYYVTDPLTTTTNGWGYTDPLNATTGLLYSDYPDYNILTGPAPDHHVGAVFVPFWVDWLGPAKNGYVGGTIIDDGGGNSHRSWTAKSTPIPDDTMTESCVANLTKSSGDCCTYPGLCDYSSAQLSDFGIDQDSPRTLTFTITNELFGEQDSSFWTMSGLPDTTTFEISGYLGDPPP